MASCRFSAETPRPITDLNFYRAGFSIFFFPEPSVGFLGGAGGPFSTDLCQTTPTTQRHRWQPRYAGSKARLQGFPSQVIKVVLYLNRGMSVGSQFQGVARTHQAKKRSNSKLGPSYAHFAFWLAKRRFILLFHQLLFSFSPFFKKFKKMKARPFPSHLSPEPGATHQK